MKKARSETFTDLTEVTAKANSKGFSKTSDGICVCEDIGERQSQQDALLVFTTDKEIDAKTLKTSVQQVIEEHENCRAGTTLCMAAISYPKQLSEEDEKEEVSTKFPTIRIANIGDSRAALILKIAEYDGAPDESYVSVLLTKDHDLEDAETRDAIVSRGGTVEYFEKYGWRVIGINGTHLNMSASIGDRLNTGMIREPDIFEHDLTTILNKIALSKKTIIDATLVLACDGLYDILKNGLSAQAHVDFAADGTRHKQESGAENPSLVSAMEEFKSVDNEEKNLAQFFKNWASKHGSTDNISITTIPLVEGCRNSKKDQNLVAIIADGHCNSTANYDQLSKSTYSGEHVSASVAASLLSKLEGKLIEDLQDGSYQELLFEFIKPTIPRTSTSPIPESSLSLEMEGCGEIGR